MNKNDILFKISGVKNIHSTTYNASEVEMAMEEYAKLKSVDFLWWNMKKNTEVSLGIIVNNDGTFDTIDELYELYLKEMSQLA